MSLYSDHLFTPINEGLFYKGGPAKAFAGAHSVLFEPHADSHGYLKDSEPFNKPGAKPHTVGDYRKTFGKIMVKRAKADGTYGDDTWKRTVKFANKLDRPDPYQSRYVG